MKAPGRIAERIGASIPCTWEELQQLVASDTYGLAEVLRRKAVKVLGSERGSVVLSELARGRTPRLVPSKDALTR